MSSAVPPQPAPQPPQIPGQVPFKSAQFEFTDEHNRTFSGLSDSMRAYANLMKILGGVFALGLAFVPGFRAFMALGHAEVDNYYERTYPRAFVGD